MREVDKVKKIYYNFNSMLVVSGKRREKCVKEYLVFIKKFLIQK